MMDLLNTIVTEGGLVFAILNAVMVPVHIYLLRRSWKIADKFQVEHGLPMEMVAQHMKVQRNGDVDAYRQVFVCAGICIFLGGATIVNVVPYLL